MTDPNGEGSSAAPHPPPGAHPPVAWRAILHEAVDRLGPARAHEARWLVERASGFTGADYYAHLDDAISTRHLSFFDQMLDRRLAGEPLQYVLGRWQFRTLELLVDRRVLIPRPETEVVAGFAIDALKTSTSRRALDLGTGSGAIALAMLVEVASATIWATDLSAQALAVARANLAGVGGRAAARVTMLQGSWYEPLPLELLGTFDVIVSNPPYIAVGASLPDEVAAWEPAAALFSGERGLDAIESVISGSPRWLTPTGTLIVELSPEQGQPALATAAASGLRGELRPDLTGDTRALVARR